MSYLAQLPPPPTWGAPNKFADWRPQQDQAVLAALDSPRRFVGLVLPTGSGKSLAAAALHYVAGHRVAILTATKALQAQYTGDFGHAGMVEIKGQNAYPCIALQPGGEFAEYAEPGKVPTCDRGPCKSKLLCPHRDAGCSYYDAVRVASESDLLVTNYAYWMAQHRYGKGLNRKDRDGFDVLVLDEGHSAPDELAGFLSTRINHSDVDYLAHTPVPAPGTPVTEWANWAARVSRDLSRQLEITPAHRAPLKQIQYLRRMAALVQQLEVIRTATSQDWILTEEEGGRATSFDPIWAAKYAHLLFLGVKKVVLTSATLTSKVADLLGIPADQMDWFEVQSSFPAARRPVYWVPTVRVDHRMTEGDVRVWIAQIDNFLRRRQDRKGIIHTVSYARRNLLLRHSEFSARMITHDTAGARAAVERFKQAPPGAILVSPSMTTGYDFPGTECEYQVLCKIPMPDSRNPVIKARTAKDKDYPAYLAMQEIVQAVGRGMRSEEEQCEVLIADDHAEWFMRKYRRFAPTWFWEGYSRRDTLPAPLEKLDGE